MPPRSAAKLAKPIWRNSAKVAICEVQQQDERQKEGGRLHLGSKRRPHSQIRVPPRDLSMEPLMCRISSEGLHSKTGIGIDPGISGCSARQIGADQARDPVDGVG